jgi:nicotinamidase-related amidase
MIPQFHSHDCVVLVVDIQTRLLAKMPRAGDLLRNSGFLLDVATALGVPVLATEQYPKGLGPTEPTIADRFTSPPVVKTAFSCWGAQGFSEQLARSAKPNVVLVGMETHVCIAQTALDLRLAGYGVCIPVDAVASRGETDHAVALRRLEAAGCIPGTVESVAFEWLRDAGHPEFKAVSRLVVGREASAGAVAPSIPGRKP